MKKTVKIIYKYKIEYEHPDHLACIIKKLKRIPINKISGAGSINSGVGEVYCYRCERVGDGIIQREKIK